MQQLGGSDAMFLNFETRNAPAHVGGMFIYDQSTAPDAKVTFKGILANFESRLHLARIFRQKLVRPPLGLDHPYWIEDPDFDLEFHVRHIALPRPGDWRQLCIQAARIHSRPLDMDRPLWEVYVIEGLDGVEGLPPGSFALLTKMHHAAIDGESGAELVAAIHDFEPDARPPAPDKRWAPEPTPTQLELTARTLVNNVRQPLRWVRVLADTAPSLARRRFSRESESLGDSEPDEPIPRTRFNARVSPHRVIDGRNFSLETVRAIRKQVEGATVNDVIVALCSGALRRYLSHHDDLPRQALWAQVPISVRTEEEKGTAGNQITQMAVRLPTGEPDALERLAAVHRATQSSKASTQAIGARNLADATQFVPGALAGVGGRLVGRLGLLHRMDPLANCVISNVPGPQVPLYMTRARLVANYGFGMPMDGLGLFHAVFSYSGRISVTVTSCREMLPDPAFYADCLQVSFDELCQAAGLA